MARTYPVDNQRKSRWWIWLIISPFALIISVLIGIGAIISLGFMPEVEVETGSEISDFNFKKLKDAGLVDSRSDIAHFYSPGGFSVLAEGYIINKEALTYYWQDEDQDLDITVYPLNEINSLTQNSAGSTFENAEFTVSTDEDYLYLYLPIDGNKHLPFIQMIRDGMVADDDNASEAEPEQP